VIEIRPFRPAAASISLEFRFPTSSALGATVTCLRWQWGARRAADVRNHTYAGAQSAWVGPQA
jgi:hypothetical protein